MKKYNIARSKNDRKIFINLKDRIPWACPWGIHIMKMFPIIKVVTKGVPDINKSLVKFDYMY